MESNDETAEYMAFMLRLWRANRAAAPGWRASLESPLTGERRGFASLEALVEYLLQQTRSGATDPDCSPENTTGLQ